ncbi:MAG TPA: hypothetical protein PKY35_11105 [Candidatus Hydrogenedentes bacterium]|nr:hypothetical protein [Candidatus Hydrogenedentota bacterium]HOL77566.1 hypothetical protein [Candidatus Hydrogenedentota bacterium]HPO84871.1 hypothetical protein [Candidatus Hydrogenedentota bacterium]
MWKDKNLWKAERALDAEDFGTTKPSKSEGQLASVDTEDLVLLGQISRSAQNLRAREVVSDVQFPAFWKGIEDRLKTPPVRSSQRFWAILSFTTAALIVALSIFLVFFGKTQPVVAQTIVEEVTTDIEGASVSWSPSEDGAMVFVRVAERDIW